MNLPHIVEAGLGLIVAWEAVHYVAPRVWRWATGKTPKLAAEARTMVLEAETAAKGLAEGVAHFDPRHAEAEAAPVVAELEADAQQLLAGAESWLAAKDAQIADLVAKAASATAQRSGFAAQIKTLLS